MGPIEHEVQGRLVLGRDQDYQTDEHCHYPGIFTLESVKEFITYAEMNGVPPSGHLRFVNGESPEELLFKLDSYGVGVPSRKVEAPQASVITPAIFALLMAIMLVTGICFGVLFS